MEVKKTEERRMKIWIATGGTGGHVFPALSVATELVKRGYSVTISADGRVKQMVKDGKIRWTNHVIVRLFQRNISQEDIEKALLNGEIIEEYENDYPYPSCLVYGINLNNKVIHIVCGLNEIELWIITAYYPDNIKWEDDLKTRKEKK